MSVGTIPIEAEVILPPPHRFATWQTKLRVWRSRRNLALQTKKAGLLSKPGPGVKTPGIYLVLGAAELAIAVELVLVVALVPEGWVTDAVEADAVFCVKPLARSLLGT